MMLQQTSAQMASHVRFGQLNDKQKESFYELFAPDVDEPHRSLSNYLNRQQTMDVFQAEVRDLSQLQKGNFYGFLSSGGRKATEVFNTRVGALALRLSEIETEGDVAETEGMTVEQIRRLPESDTIKGDNSDILTREAIKRAQDMVDLYTRVKSVSAEEFRKVHSAVVDSWQC